MSDTTITVSTFIFEDMCFRITDLEAKLQKAVESLRVIEDASRLYARDRESDIENVRYAHECTRRLCVTTLAELSGVSCANLKGQGDE